MGGSAGGEQPRRCSTDADCTSSGANDKKHCRADGWCASQIFETVWNIPASKRTLILPYYDDMSGSAKCDFTILWGDEGAGSDFRKGTRVTDCFTKNNITHTYATAGTYHVKIKGVYNGWGAGPYKKDAFDCKVRCKGHMLKRLVEVVRFGPVGLTARAFACTDGVKLPAGEVPNASLWRNGYEMFACADAIGEAITRWDSANVINMRGMFDMASAFNQPLNNWNTSNVTSMWRMFAYAAAFDQNLAPWNVADVTSMEDIFHKSGITKPNYCAVKSLSVWKNADLSVSFDCP